MTESKIILYADDDLDDQAWVTDACKALGTNMDVHFVRNGREVIRFLEEEPAKAPSLVVLDLNMPEMDGRQTLMALKKSDSHKDIPVAIVSTSSSKIDKDVCQRLGAELYLTKPDTHLEWRDIILALDQLIR